MADPFSQAPGGMTAEQYRQLLMILSRAPGTGYGGMMPSPPPAIGYGGMPGGETGYGPAAVPPLPSPLPPQVQPGGQPPATEPFLGGSGYGGIGGGTLPFPPQAAGPQVLPEPAPGDPGFMGPQQEPPRADYGGGSYPGELPMRFPPAPPRGTAPTAPAGGNPDYGITVGPFPEEEIPPLPTPPEADGDLARDRAGRELAQLENMRAMAEGFGNMNVVTTGDVLHRTAKGMGTAPRWKAEGIRGTIESKRGLAGATALEDRKQAGRRELAEAALGTGVGGLSKRQQDQLLSERSAFRRSERFRGLRKASTAAERIKEFVNTGGSIAHQTAARMLLQAAGESGRFSERDLEGVIKRAGVIQSTWDRLVRFGTGDMSEGLKDEYVAIADKLIAYNRQSTNDLAYESAEGFSGETGIPVERVVKSYLGDAPPKGGYKVRHKGTGKELDVTKEQHEKVRAGSKEWEAL